MNDFEKPFKITFEALRQRFQNLRHMYDYCSQNTRISFRPLSSYIRRKILVMITITIIMTIIAVIIVIIQIMIDKLQEMIKAENWHERLFTTRWKDEELSQDARFTWMKECSSGTHPYSCRYDRTL